MSDNQTIKYVLDIDTRSIESLEAELNQLKGQLNVEPRGSAAWTALQQKVVSLDANLKNIKKSTEGLDFDALAGEASKFAGGVGAVTGAFVLLGGEGNKTAKELQENMNKGVGIMMAAKGAVEIWTSSTKLLKAANIQLNATMLLNPVFLIIAGVAALGASVYYLVSVLNEEAKATNTVNGELADYNKANKIVNDNLEDRIELLKAAGATELEILEVRKASNKLSMELALGEYTRAKDFRDQQEKNTTAWLDANNTMIAAAKNFQSFKNTDLELDKKNNIEKVKDNKKTNDEIAVNNKSTLEKIKSEKEAKIKEEQDAISKNLDYIKEQKYKELAIVSAKSKEELDLILKGFFEQSKGMDDVYTKLQTNKQNEIDTVDKTYKQLFKTAKGNASATIALTEAKAKEIEQIEKKYRDQDLEDFNKTEDEKLAKQQKNLYKFLEISSTLANGLNVIDKKKMEKDLENAEGNAEQQDRIRQEYDERARNRNRIFAGIEGIVALADITMATSTGIAKATAAAAPFIANPLTTAVATPLLATEIGTLIASGVVNGGIVAAQTAIKIASMGKGGMISGPSHQSAAGGVLINGEGGEAVINKRSTRMYAPVLSKINEAGGGNSFASGSIIDYDLLASKINDKKVFVTDRDMTRVQAKTARITDRSRY